MPPAGQNLFENMVEKYGSNYEQSSENRGRFIQLGSDLGFTFNYSDESRMVNTFLAHQLLHWAETPGRGHELKMALFTAHFTNGLVVSDV